MSALQEAKDRWIADTQMYERIARKPESSYVVLAAVYDEMITDRRARRRKTLNRS